MKFLDLFELDEKQQVMDVGASVISEVPRYKALLDEGLAHLNAFEGDEKQIQGIRETFGEDVSIFEQFLFDGSEREVYLCTPESGMTSLYKPKPAALRFFNGFERFGTVHSTAMVKTQRLDDIYSLPNIDLAKMDIQGAELTVLKNGTSKLAGCLAVQLEVSYFNLYEEQPSFGDIDVWMRQNGFVPHCFVEVKRWSIAPTIFDRNFRIPGNQLLESDIVYIKDPLRLDQLDNQQLKKLVTIAHFYTRSVDLCIYLLNETIRRNLVGKEATERYLTSVN